MTLWQEKHDSVPVDDRRGSKNSILPSSILAGVEGLSADSGALDGSACQSADHASGLTNNVSPAKRNESKRVRACRATSAVSTGPAE